MKVDQTDLLAVNLKQFYSKTEVLNILTRNLNETEKINIINRISCLGQWLMTVTALVVFYAVMYLFQSSLSVFPLKNVLFVLHGYVFIFCCLSWDYASLRYSSLNGIVDFRYHIQIRTIQNNHSCLTYFSLRSIINFSYCQSVT